MAFLTQVGVIESLDGIFSSRGGGSTALFFRGVLFFFFLEDLMLFSFPNCQETERERPGKREKKNSSWGRTGIDLVGCEGEVAEQKKVHFFC